MDNVLDLHLMDTSHIPDLATVQFCGLKVTQSIFSLIY